ncbi:MAG: helix-hairpin-helix domain-containing protein [Coriobacteriia bacterium]|nr:helix-hairpin-helix domain-containing protein [Coriobacteriia bacterium]
MHTEARERVEDLLARAGLGGVKRNAVKAAVVVAAAVVGFALLRGGTGPAVEFTSSGSENSAVEVSPENTVAVAAAEVVVVHVAGAVRTPGVYELAASARVDDAIRAAGGGLGDAAIDALNLARVLTDGEQVYVPTEEEVAAGVVTGAGGASGLVAGATGSGGLVNLNTATVADLDALPGIGPSTAQKIVDDRSANGPFATVDDLMRVSGIGAAKMGSLRDLVTVK